VSELGLTLATVLAASLLGSLHCVGMCGGFVAIVSGPGQRGPLVAYQAARGLAYASLGALAGLLGAGLDASAAMLGIQRAAGPLMGVVLIAMAVITWRGAKPVATPLITLGAAPRRNLMQRLRLRLITAVREHGTKAGAAAGLLTALLPCGWLWAYLAVAASTGSVGGGLLVMTTFWLGSVPALLGVGLLANELGRRLGRHAPHISAALLLALGVLSLAGKLSIAPIHTEHAEPEPTTSAPAELPREAPCH
jgi:sulfite exporter TauE/SafE